MKPKKSKTNGVNGTRTQRNGRNSYEVTWVASDRRQVTAHKPNLEIGTWNVRTLFKTGQLENVLQEMHKTEA